MTLEQDIRKAIDDISIQEDRLSDKVFRVSEICYCKRKPLFYRKNKVVSRPNGKTLAGTLFHTLIPKLFEKIGGFVEPEYEKELSIPVPGYENKFSLVGHCDAITKDTVYEFKFTGKVEYTEDNLPLQYRLQANMYAAMSGRTRWCIVLVHSDSLDTRTYEGTFDSELWNESLNQVEDYIRYNRKSEEKITKEFEGPRYPWECRYCSEAEECFKERGSMEEYEKMKRVSEAIKWKGVASKKKVNAVTKINDEMIAKAGVKVKKNKSIKQDKM